MNERSLLSSGMNIFLKKELSKAGKVEKETQPPKSTLRPPHFKYMKVFIQRDLMSKLSNQQYLVINLLEAPLLAILLAFLLRYSEQGEAYWFGKTNILAYLFMSVIVLMEITVSIEKSIKDQKNLKREAFLNLSRSNYLLSEIVILFSISAIQTLLFVLISNSILEMQGMILIN